MRHILFISDLHLCESRPYITQSFIAFLRSTARHADALYILGDLFEYWAGDDAIEAGVHRDIIAALRETSRHVPIFFMHGNRDFLIGQSFSTATGVTLLADPTLLDLFGHPVLLSHGDTLCTDDIAYQSFRAEVRNPDWQAKFLAQPLRERIAYIEDLRAKSEQEKSAKSMQIMDVNEAAVKDFFAHYNFPLLFIHGHTHRPKAHEYWLASHHCTRWVLGDWCESGSCLKLTKNGCEMLKL